MDESLKARWLLERSSAVGYVVIVVSASFGGQGATWSCDFACLPKTGGRRNLMVTVEEAEAKNVSWSKW